MTQSLLDNACFHLFVHYDDLDHVIQVEVNKLRDEITHTVISRSDIHDSIERSLSQIFSLRLKGLVALADEEKSYSDLFDEAYLYFSELRGHHKYDGLSENILFALRSCQRISDVFLKNMPLETLSEQVSHLPENFTYEVLVATIKTAPLHFSEVFLDWIKSSFTIEYVTCAFALIHKEKIDAATDMIEQLAEITASSAQLFSAISIELGILKLSSQTESTNTVSAPLNPDDIQSQQLLADLGLEDFAKLWRTDD